MPHDEKMGAYSPKPESDIMKTQQPSPGSYDKDLCDHTKVEEEVAYMGVSVNPIGGHGQGGAGH